MQNYLLKQISVVNENNISEKDVYIKNGRIERIGKSVNVKERVVRNKWCRKTFVSRRY